MVDYIYIFFSLESRYFARICLGVDSSRSVFSDNVPFPSKSLLFSECFLEVVFSICSVRMLLFPGIPMLAFLCLL